MNVDKCVMKKLIGKIETGAQKLLPGSGNENLVVLKSPRQSAEESCILLNKAFHVLGYTMCGNSLDQYQLFLECLFYLFETRDAQIPFMIHVIDPSDEHRMFLNIIVNMIQSRAPRGERIAEYVNAVEEPLQFVMHRLLVIDAKEPFEFPSIWEEKCPSLIVVGDMWFSDKFGDRDASHLVCQCATLKKGQTLSWLKPMERVLKTDDYFKPFIATFLKSCSFPDTDIMIHLLKTCNLSPTYIKMRLGKFTNVRDKFVWNLITDGVASLESKLDSVAQVFNSKNHKIPNRIIIMPQTELKEIYDNHFKDWPNYAYDDMDAAIKREFPFILKCGDRYVINEFITISYLLFQVDPFITSYFVERQVARRWLYDHLVDGDFIVQWASDCEFKTRLRDFLTLFNTKNQPPGSISQSLPSPRSPPRSPPTSPAQR